MGKGEEGKRRRRGRRPASVEGRLPPRVRWEFLRRNTTYQEDYYRWVQLHSEWQDVYAAVAEMDPENAASYPQCQLAWQRSQAQRHELCVKWRLDRPCDPWLCASDLEPWMGGPFRAGTGVTLKIIGEGHWLFSVPDSSKEIVSLPYESGILKGVCDDRDGEGTPGEPGSIYEAGLVDTDGVVLLQVDATIPPTQVGSLVAELLAELQSVEPWLRMKGRARDESEYLDYLRVYDQIHELTGEERAEAPTYEQIARRLSPKQYRVDPEAAVKRVQRAYRRAYQLIHGTNPPPRRRTPEDA